MIITELEIRCCRHSVEALSADSMRSADHQRGLEFLVVTLRTDAGLEASSFGFAGRSARGSGELAAAAMRPFLVGKHALHREEIWQRWRTEDRWWNHLPIYSYGPFDIALWLLGAQAAEQPLYRYIGARSGSRLCQFAGFEHGGRIRRRSQGHPRQGLCRV
jgi:L-alanine-DL-glutamate epimerase-like enolase superfamily enzyme